MLQVLWLSTAGYSPVWNDELTFKLHVPDLVLVNFAVYTKDSFVAQLTLPFSSIMQGRSFDLFFAIINTNQMFPDLDESDCSPLFHFSISRCHAQCTSHSLGQCNLVFLHTAQCTSSIRNRQLLALLVPSAVTIILPFYMTKPSRPSIDFHLLHVKSLTQLLGVYDLTIWCASSSTFKVHSNIRCASCNYSSTCGMGMHLHALFSIRRSPVRFYFPGSLKRRIVNKLLFDGILWYPTRQL